MALFAKTGGLADVSAALPKSLVRRGHQVFLPHYGSIAFPPGEFVGPVHVPVDALPRSAGFYRRKLPDGVNLIFVEPRRFSTGRTSLGGQIVFSFARRRRTLHQPFEGVEPRCRHAGRRPVRR
jgi:hypothetical protein